MLIPNELLYTKDHEWIRFTGENSAEIGITDFAQNALGDLVFVNLPQIGDEAVAGGPIGDLESVKAVSDVFSPASGVVSEVNEALLDQPELINQQPYEAWLYRLSDITQREELLDAAAYEALCAEEA